MYKRLNNSLILLCALIATSFSSFAQDFKMAHSSLESNVDLFKAFNGATYDNYHKYETHDMNGDGIIDRVECGGGSAGYFVRITDLKTNNRVDLSKPAMSFVHGSLTGWRLVTGCSLVEIKKGHPSVVVSSYKPMSNGARWGVDQYLLYNVGSGTLTRRFKLRQIHLGSASGFAIDSVARDVRCTRYPAALESQFGEGALCFFSGYHGDSVLTKIEPNGDQIRSLDITPNSGLVWNLGNRSDSGAWYGYYNYDSCQRSTWGSYYTIGGAWFDFNKDGKPDLVTTGQHAPTWANTMTFDLNSTQTEGIKFTRSMIYNNSNTNVPTEFIRITALNEIEPELPASCVYMSMEWQGCGDVQDHLLCYNDGAWERKNLPNKFVSLYRKPSVKGNGQGQVLLKTKQMDGTDRTYFYDYQGQLVGEISHWSQDRQNVYVKGFACTQNTENRIQVRAANEGKFILNQQTSEKLSDAQKIKCMQPGDQTLAFDLTIPKSKASPKDKTFKLSARDRVTGKILNLGSFKLN